MPELDEQRTKELRDIIRRMSSDGVPDEKIRGFVSRYKQKFTPKESLGQEIVSDAKIGWRSGWSHAAHTAANAAEMVGANETAGKLKKFSEEEAPKEQEVVGRDSVLDQTVMGAFSMAGGLAENLPALLAKGKASLVAGAIGYIANKDKGFWEGVRGGVKAAAEFKAMEFGQNFPTRLTRAVGSAAAAGGVAAAEEGFDRPGSGSAQRIASATILGAAGGIVSGKPHGKTLLESIPKGERIEAVKRMFMPSKVSPEAKETTANIRQTLAQRSRLEYIAHEQMQHSRSLFDKQPVDTSAVGGFSKKAREFMKSYQSGQKQDISDPILRHVAPVLQEAFHARAEQLKARFLLKTELENYLGQIVTHEGKEKSDLVKQFSSRPLQGAAGFQNKRVFSDVEDFLTWAEREPEASKGMKLLSNNPIDLSLFRLREMDKLITAHDFALKEMQEGLLHYVRPEDEVNGASLKRQGWVPAPAGLDKALAGLTAKLVEDSKDSEHKVQFGGRYYMPQDAAMIVDNLMATGLKDNPITEGLLYGSGALNKAQLSVTFRHAVTTAIEASVGQMALAEKYLATGIAQRRPEMILKAIKSTGRVLTSPVEPWTNVASMLARSKVLRDPVTGKLSFKPGAPRSAPGRFARNFINPGEFPEMEAMNELYVTAGGRGGQDPIYRAGDWRKAVQATRGIKQVVKTAWKDYDHFMSINPAYRGDLMKRLRMISDVAKIGSGMAHVLPAAIEKMTTPIFEYAVPMYKQAAFTRMMEYELDRLKPKLEEVGSDSPTGKKLIRDAAQRVHDSVDNRLGQLVYDNLAWNTALKNTLMMTIRSVGWQGGTFMEIIGGGLDWKKAATDTMRGKQAEFTHKMAYTIALPVVIGTMGMMMNYLMTGELPKDMKDLFMPRTGEKDENGVDKRIEIPSYMHNVLKAAPLEGENTGGREWRYLTGILNPVVEIINEFVQNSDFDHNQIRDRDGNPQEQLEGFLKYGLSQYLPISFRSLFNKSRYKGIGAEQWKPTIGEPNGGGRLGKFHAGTLAKSMFGISPAPSDQSMPAYERFENEHMGTGSESGGRKPQVAQKAQYRRDLLKAIRYKNEGEFKTLFDEAVRKGLFLQKDEKTIRKNARMAAGVFKFTKLGTVDKAQAYIYALKDPKVPQEDKDLMRSLLSRSLGKDMDKISAWDDSNEDVRKEKIRFFNNIHLINLLDPNGNFKQFDKGKQ